MNARTVRTTVLSLATAAFVVSLLAGCGAGATATSSAPTTAASVEAAVRPAEPTPSPAATVAVKPAPSAAASPASVPEQWPMPANAALPKETAARLQAALEGLVGRSSAKGAAAAIVTPDGSWVGVTGVDGAGKSIRPTSAFGIGSTSKTVTAAEILLLASQGKLDLDSPVADLVTLPFDAQGATIRQLAMMQSGFPVGSDSDLETAIAKDLNRTWTIGDLLEGVKNAPRAGTVGGPGQYNGINYQVLSQVIERVTGDSLSTVLRRDLLEPAGLDRMWTQIGEQPQAPLAIAVDPGTGIVDAKGGFLPSRAAASTGNGAAGMAADAPTLARWGYLLYGGRVLEPAVLATMMKPNWGSENGYGFGAMFDNGTGTLVVGHGGDYMGYSSMLLAWPSTQTAVAVLAPREGMTVGGTVPGWGFELYKTLVAGG
jgi:D-alanyl-D-alanine carboxypeptidase